MNYNDEIDILKTEQVLKKAELEDVFSNTFKALKAKLTKLNKNDNLLDAVLKLSYLTLEEFIEEEDDGNAVCLQHSIDKELHFRKDKKGKDNFLCLCGKTHLKHLNIFSLSGKEENIILGSSCINQIEKLKQVFAENQILCMKIDEILNNQNNDLLKKYNNKCMVCKKYTIKKSTEYKNKLKNKICGGCIHKKNHIYCADCPKLIPIEFIRGDIKRLCKSCWWIRRKNGTLFT